MPGRGDSLRRVPHIRQPSDSICPTPAMCWTAMSVRWTRSHVSVRREIRCREPERRPPTFEPDLFRARFTLLRRADHLTEGHQAHLDRLFEAHPRLRTAWDALQELYQLYEAEDLDRANQALDGSLTYTTPDRSPNTAKSWTPSSPGEKKSWPTTPPHDGYPTDLSKEPTTSSRSYAASLTASPTTTITQPEEFS